jgi:hypothetical protein
LERELEEQTGLLNALTYYDTFLEKNDD